MGGTASLFHHHHPLDISLEMCISLVMPMYYTTDAVDEDDLNRARVSWNHVVRNTAPAYLALKANPTFNEVSCLSYFYNIFYNRLYSVHPACRPLFKNNIQTQGKALAKLISFLLQDHNDPDCLVKVLTDMAHRHVHKYGVKAHEYAIMGEVLIFSLSKVVGMEDFDAATTQSWVRIFCMIITHLIPHHVRHELEESRHPPVTHDETESEKQKQEARSTVSLN